MGQRATIIFEDEDDGQLSISMQFEPEITDETRSGAVSVATRCMDFIMNELKGSEVG